MGLCSAHMSAPLAPQSLHKKLPAKMDRAPFIIQYIRPLLSSPLLSRLLPTPPLAVSQPSPLVLPPLSSPHLPVTRKIRREHAKLRATVAESFNKARDP